MTGRSILLKSVDAIDITEADQFNNIENSLNESQKVIPIFNPEVMQKVREEILLRKQKLVEQRKELLHRPEIKVFFTKDQELLKQYYDLRYKVYTEENGWEKYEGGESEFDRQGKIIVAVENDKVVGGARLMFSDECEFLSNEIPGTEFNYRRLIQKYDKRENLKLAEISALVVEKNHRNSQAVTPIVDVIVRKSKLHGYHYIFAVASALLCRDHRGIAKCIGYDVEIMTSIIWKQQELYNFAQMFPLYSKLQ